MALTMKLPERSNKVTFTNDEVADIRLTLLNPELPKGEGVVIAEACDTEPKARVRCRNMVVLLKDEQTVTADDVPADFWQDDENLAEFVTEYENEPEEGAEDDAPLTYTLPALRVRTHTVEQDGKFYPLLSLKP